MLYIIIFLFLLFLSIHYDANGIKTKDNSIYWGICGIFILIMGLRYRVGGDTFVYMKYFETVPNLFNISKEYLAEVQYEKRFGYLWSIFVATCKTVSPTFTFFQFVHAFIINSIIFKVIIDKSEYKFFTILLYYIFYFLYFNTEILRESLAIVIFLMSLDSFMKKRWLVYYTWVAIAFLIHISASILILFPLLHITNRLSFRTVLIIFAGLVFLTPVVQWIFIDFLLSHISEKTLQWKIIKYASHEANLNGVIMSLGKSFVTLFLFYVNEKVLGVKFQYRSLLLAFVLFTIIAIYIYPFARFLNYLAVIQIIFIGEAFSNIFRSKIFFRIRQPIIAFLFIILLLPKIYYYVRDTSFRVPDTRFYNIWIPYRTIILKKKDQTREKLVKTFDPLDPSYLKKK